MPAPRTATTYALLGLLRLRTWTTYELAKQVQRSLNWFWPRAERKLYDEPKRLVADGLATASSESTGKRPRTVYAITDAGRAALREWLSEISSPRSAEFEAMVKVFFADAGTGQQLRTTLERIQSEAAERIGDLADLTDGIIANPAFPERLHLNALTVRLQLEQELAIHRWCSWAIAETSQWARPDDPANWDVQAVLRDVVADSRQVVTIATRHTPSS